MEELQVKGPTVMKGYWKRPDATAEVFTEDGWFKTGDQADLSDAGRHLSRRMSMRSSVGSTLNSLANFSHSASLTKEHGSGDTGCLPVPMKLRRPIIREKLRAEIDELYTVPQNNV